VCFFIRKNPAYQVNLTVFQSRFVLDAALSNREVTDSTDILRNPLTDETSKTIFRVPLDSSGFAE